MSLDRSLKTGGGLTQHRSVLTRTERLAKMKADGKIDDGESPLGLPKCLNPKPVIAKKPKKKDGEEEATTDEVATTS